MNFSLEKVLVLKNIPAFSEVSESALSDLIHVCEELAFSKGQVILHKGQKNNYLYIVITGLVQITDGKNISFEVGSQELFGENTALSPSVLETQITALENTILLRIETENLYEMMSLHPSIAKGIIKTLANRLKILDNKHI